MLIYMINEGLIMKYLVALVGFCISLVVIADDYKSKIQKEYFGNGKPKFEVTYKHGKKNGKEIFWYENGNKMMESFFKDDHEEGLWLQWYPNGQKKIEVNYTKGKYNGLWQQWYEGGQKKKIVKFSMLSLGHKAKLLKLMHPFLKEEAILRSCLQSY